MAVTLSASGSQSMATVGQEKTLASPTAAGVYVLEVDLSVLLAGDVLEIRVYKKVLPGSSFAVCQYAMYAGAQPTDDAVKFSLPQSTSGAGLSFRMTQTFGTARTIDWALNLHS